MLSLSDNVLALLPFIEPRHQRDHDTKLTKSSVSSRYAAVLLLTLMRSKRRERRREGRREGKGMGGGREEGREGGKGKGMKGGREEGREGGREGGRGKGKEGGRIWCFMKSKGKEGKGGIIANGSCYSGLELRFVVVRTLPTLVTLTLAYPNMLELPLFG
jgi:hypothetical protein